MWAYSKSSKKHLWVVHFSLLTHPSQLQAFTSHPTHYIHINSNLCNCYTGNGVEFGTAWSFCVQTTWLAMVSNWDVEQRQNLEIIIFFIFSLLLACKQDWVVKIWNLYPKRDFEVLSPFLGSSSLQIVSFAYKQGPEF